MEIDIGSQIAESYDALEAEMFSPEILNPAVESLARLTQGRRTLELGIGTGRLAIPLVEQGIDVHGIEISPAMANVMHRKCARQKIGVTIGDFTKVRAPGLFGAAYLGFNTIMALTTQDRQIACFRNVARHLDSG